MKHDPSAVTHAYDIEYIINSIKRTGALRILASNPHFAMFQAHQTLQNSQRWNPDDYTITLVKRDGLTPYDLPPVMKNPDVRPVYAKPMTPQTGELFPLEEVLSDSPSAVQKAEQRAASNASL